MMAKEQDERTPLIRSTPSNGPRRRVPQSSLSDTTNVVVSPSVQDNDKDDDDDTNKNEKRFFGQSLITFCQSRKAAHDERFHDERYYEDDVNDFSWECSFGTSHDNGIWLNRKDKGGMLMALIVWLLVVYCGMSVTLLAATSKHLSYIIAAFHNTICVLALASHAKCMCTDPGAIPPTAVPPLHVQAQTSVHAMCSHCQSYKPVGAHHCRVCNRCISRMDHHCPWMNNCIGAGNLKFFILFLTFTWIASVLTLVIFGATFVVCSNNSEACTISPILLSLMRVMTIICIGALVFISNMLMTVVYTILTGLTTIDRLKRKANNTLVHSDEEPMNLEDIFGIQGYWTWPLPIEPVFEDWDRVMGYSTTERLLREQQHQHQHESNGFYV